MILRGVTFRAGAIVCALLLLAVHPYVLAAADGPSATMLPWEPGSPVQLGQTVTFHASATDDSQVQGFEWDLDGDGNPDAFSAASAPGKSATGSTEYSFSAPATVIPAVRAVDDEGFVSAWDVLEEGGSPVQLVIGGTEAPQVEMERWEPFSAAGPDGPADTAFLFSASASSGAGLDRLEWDFDGDGTADATSALSGTSDSAAISHSYGAAGVWMPQVRAVDAAGLPSVWVQYEQEGNTVMLDTSVPEIDAAMTFVQVGETIVEENDAVSADFTFTVETDVDVASFQWDFDGDGDVDLETTSPNASYTYTRRGLFLPSVTVQDKFGTRAFVSPIDAQGQPLYATILAPGEDPALFDPVRTYCDNMTIEQLIATGRYNVMDFRTSSHTIIRGTLHDDLILGGRVHNLILGSAGDDCIITGGGSGQAYGNSGNDIIIGSESDERLVGGAGNDVCIPLDGVDVTVSCESTVYEF